MRYDKIARAQLREHKPVRARYVGPRDDLRGETALVRLSRWKGETGELMAQFDGHWPNIPSLGYGWHPFKRSDFKLQPSVSDYFALSRLQETFREFYGPLVADKFRADYPDIVKTWNNQRQLYEYAATSYFK